MSFFSTRFFSKCQSKWKKVKENHFSDHTYATCIASTPRTSHTSVPPRVAWDSSSKRACWWNTGTRHTESPLNSNKNPSSWMQLPQSPFYLEQLSQAGKLSVVSRHHPIKKMTIQCQTLANIQIHLRLSWLYLTLNSKWNWTLSNKVNDSVSIHPVLVQFLWSVLLILLFLFQNPGLLRFANKLKKKRQKRDNMNITIEDSNLRQNFFQVTDCHT